MSNKVYIIDCKKFTDQYEQDEDVLAFAKNIIQVLKEFKEKARQHPLIDNESWEDYMLEIDEMIEYFELQSMDDPSTIGPAMAVALLTTFYGSLMANIVCMPIAGKLKARSREESLTKELTIQGVLSLSNGDNPRILEQKLHAFVPPKQRESA